MRAQLFIWKLKVVGSLLLYPFLQGAADRRLAPVVGELFSLLIIHSQSLLLIYLQQWEILPGGVCG